MAKSRQGERVYQHTPTIEDPAEFGLAIVKWWNAMQPDFRHSDAGMPKPVYSTDTSTGKDWALLRRAGPNGLVSMLTLLAWWGQSLQSRTQWQDDSGPLWTEAITDVTKVINVLKAVSGGVKKRKADTDPQIKGSKR